MVNKAKRTGGKWEHDLAEELTKLIPNSRWVKIPGSGSMGTSLNEPLLTADVKGVINNFYKQFKVECKVGYSRSTEGEAKSFTLEKKWLDKIQEEAKGNYSIPLLAGKFDNVRTGVKHFIVMDINDFAEIISKIIELQEMLEDE